MKEALVNWAWRGALAAFVAGGIALGMLIASIMSAHGPG